MRIGVVGAGTMGSGIALAALYEGLDVVLQDAFPEALSRARLYIQSFLEKKGLRERLEKVHFTEGLDALSGCDVVIEAALEDLDLKREIFRQLSEICPGSTILATNTSTLSVTAIFAGAKRPDRGAGMHFFNPAPVLPLVEVVRGALTSDETVTRLVALARRLGKTPVETADSPGFIVNRVARPYYGEALRLLGEGVGTHQEIDLALRLGAGFRMGPFELMDLIGIDINTAAMKSLYEQTFGEPRYRPHPIQLRQVASGDLGRKTGRGFYDSRSEVSGVRVDTPPEMGGGHGQVLVYDGFWTCGFDGRLRRAGYLPEPFPENVDDLAAVVVTQAHDLDLAAELQRIDWLLPETVPVFVQCLDATLDAYFLDAEPKGRFIGFDPLFAASGRAATLIPGPGLTAESLGRAERFAISLGLLPLWISDSPGLVLPRVVAMLVNEAAFAVQEGVGTADGIDLAMRLGVNYPMGPVQWGRELGWARVLAVLEHLQSEFGEARYRPCQLLRRWARQESRGASGVAPLRRDPWDV